MDQNTTKFRYTKRWAAGIIILLLLAGNVFFAARCFLGQQEASEIRQKLATQQTNSKIATFLDLFVEKVLKAKNEVTFDDRLELENAVRNLKDDQVLDRWEKFTNAQSEEQVQEEVKNLLEVLVKKLAY